MRAKMSSIDTHTLDLHGVLHREVSREVDSFLYYHMLNGSIMVSIITGNSEEMKRIVGEVLSEYGFEFRESLWNSGTLVVIIE
tara:strand:+ start:1167 stop:1415 length:249 start_codon:yes stop_codon:yes gene_type:complete